MARTLKSHWDEGHGATYNPKRKEALSVAKIVSSLDEAIYMIDELIERVDYYLEPVEGPTAYNHLSVRLRAR